MKRILAALLCAFLILPFAQGWNAPASAAELAVPKIPRLVNVPRAPCTMLTCSGWYAGVSIIGVGSNVDILGSGIRNSVFADGAALGLVGGYQVWEGNYFFAAEIGGAYQAAGNPVLAGRDRPRWITWQLVKFGGLLSGLFSGDQTTPTQTPDPITIPQKLAASLLSPYVQLGFVERPWGAGWATGAGAEFIIAPGWNADLSYLYVEYDGAAVNPAQHFNNENLIKLSVIRKF